MSIWRLCYTKKAIKDAQKLKRAEESVVQSFSKLLLLLSQDPLKNPPPYEKLVCSQGRYSRRINVKHRLVYTIDKKKHEITIVSAWGHYDDN